MLKTLCPSAEQLAAFQIGMLDHDDLDQIAEHLQCCGACQTVLQTGSTASDALIRELKQAEQDAYTEESGCHRAVAKAEAIAHGTVTHTRAETADNMPPSPLPMTLGKYQLLAQIGRGGMGTVYKATHTLLKRTVALKVLPADRLKNPQAVSRFRREIEATGRLDHPNIVRTSDADQADGQHFLVMEWLDGQDLAHFVRAEGALPVAQACDFIRQAALGLDCAHQRGLVHRDVKPSNLMLTMLDGRPVVKVLDLGLALLNDSITAETELTSAGQVMGTYDFIAPEQAMESHSVDARADMYSLGCTFYFLLTGRAPFSGTSETKKLLAHQLENPRPLTHFRSDVPSEVIGAVAKMMAKDPAQRYGSMRELAAILSTTISTSPSTPQGGQRRIAIFAVVGLLLLIGSGVMIPQIIIRLTDDKGKVREIPVKPGTKIEIAQKAEEKKKDPQNKPDSVFAWPAAALRDGRISAPDLSKLKPRFNDEFDDPTSGWISGTISQPSGWTLEYGYDKGKYRIHHPTTGGSGVVRAAWGKHSNVAVQVTARLASPSANEWGIAILHENDKRDLHVSFSADGRFAVELRGEGWTSSRPFQPFRHQSIAKPGEFNTLLIVVRERLVELYVNSVAVCNPLVLEQGLTPCLFNITGGGEKDARIEFERFTVWSAEGIPTPQERLAKDADAKQP